MKKITVIFLSIIILCSFSVLVQAEDKDYDVQVHSVSQVYYYDAEKGPECYWMNFRITTTQLDVFERVEYDITINHEIVELQYVNHGNIGSYFRDIKETETGFLYKTALRDGEPSDTVTVVFDITGVGDLNFDVTATGYYPDGTQKQLNIDLKKPYDKVVDISEVEFLGEEKYEYVNQYVLADYGTTASELVSASGAKTAVVINADGEILENDAAVPNGAYLATMYEGFVVDKVQFCVMEDVNCDGKVTAADARLTLRCAAKLENLQGVVKIAADMNLDNKITAADARIIIRKAAKLDVSDIPVKEEPSTEIDKFTVSAGLKNEYVDKQEECKAYFEDCEYIKGIIVFSTLDGVVGLEFSLTGTGAEKYDETVEFIENSGFFSAIYYHKV